MIAIIDYDTGNTRNVKKAMDFLAIPNTLSADPDVILKADGLILPGVGAFGKAVEALKARELIPVLKFLKTLPKAGCLFWEFAWECSCCLTAALNSVKRPDWD